MTAPTDAFSLRDGICNYHPAEKPAVHMSWKFAWERSVIFFQEWSEGNADSRMKIRLGLALPLRMDSRQEGNQL